MNMFGKRKCEILKCTGVILNWGGGVEFMGDTEENKNIFYKQFSSFSYKTIFMTFFFTCF